MYDRAQKKIRRAPRRHHLRSDDSIARYSQAILPLFPRMSSPAKHLARNCDHVVLNTSSKSTRLFQFNNLGSLPTAGRSSHQSASWPLNAEYIRSDESAISTTAVPPARFRWEGVSALILWGNVENLSTQTFFTPRILFCKPQTIIPTAKGMEDLAPRGNSAAQNIQLADTATTTNNVTAAVLQTSSGP